MPVSHFVTRYRRFDQPKPRFSRLHVKKPYGWNYATTPQPGFNGRSIPYARGKVLDGSSSISKSSSWVTVTLLAIKPVQTSWRTIQVPGMIGIT